MNTISISVTLTPQKQISKIDHQTYYEQIKIDVQDYPTALVHIDTFWSEDGREIYDSLRQGKIFTGTATFRLQEVK